DGHGRTCPATQSSAAALYEVDARDCPGKTVFVNNRLVEYSAHHAADEGTRTAQRTAAMMATTAAAVMPRLFTFGIVVGAGVRGRDDFCEQRLVLQRVEEAGRGITARSLPARNDGAGRLIELAVHPGVEAEPGQSPLHVTPLRPVESDLVFGDLGGLRREGSGIGPGRQIARRGRWSILQRGNTGQRQRLELPVG